MTAVWLGASALWIRLDRGLMDGDEAGHVGAAALVRGMLADGHPLDALATALWGDLGEYPGLYPAVVGLWWAALGGGLPGRVAVRALNLAWVWLAAFAAGRLARRGATRPDLAEGIAFGAGLCLPLANGLGRHFMPEGALTAAVALAWLALARAAEHPSLGRLLAAGAACGLAFLTKQTALLTLAGPAAWAVWTLRGRAWPLLGAAAAVATPWALAALPRQLDYGARSIGAQADHPLWMHLAYYPVVGAALVLGPVLSVALLGSLAALVRARLRPTLLVVALIGGGVALTTVPKKYPRLLAPLGPAAVALVGLAASRARRPGAWAVTGGALAGGWLGYASAHTVPLPRLVEDMDPNCVQIWLGPPQPDAFGLPEVLAAAAAHPGPVAVIAAPEIPCEVETTLPWIDHLRAALEYAGLDREVLEVAAGETPPPASVIVDWTGGAGSAVPVPALGVTMVLRGSGEEPW